MATAYENLVKHLKLAIRQLNVKSDPICQPNSQVVIRV